MLAGKYVVVWAAEADGAEDGVEWVARPREFDGVGGGGDSAGRFSSGGLGEHVQCWTGQQVLLDTVGAVEIFLKSVLSAELTESGSIFKLHLINSLEK